MRLQFSILFSLTLFVVSVSQDFNAEYNVFSTKDGLCDNIVNEVTQDDRGIFWIATQNGLSRFDNLNFINFSSKTDSVFFKDNVVDAFCKYQSEIWLLSKRYGVLRLNPLTGEFRWKSRKGILAADALGDTTVLYYADGTLEVQIKEKLVSSKKFPVSDFASVLIFNKKIYLATPNAFLQILDLSSLKNLNRISAEPMLVNGKLLRSKKYKIIYHSGRKVFYSDDGFTLKSHPDIESQFYVSSFCENDKNEPGFINNFKIPYVSAFGFFNKISFNRKLNAQIRSIYFMNERSFILSTNQGFLKSTFKQNISTSLDDNPFFKEELLRFREGYVEGSDSAVYFLGYPGIIRYKNNKVNVLDTNQFKTKSGAWINNRLYCIAEGRGLVSYNPEKKYALQQHVTKDLSSLDSLTCLFKLNDSELLLFGNQKTLIYQAQEQNSILLNVPKGLTFQKVVRDEVSGNFFGITHNELVQFSLSNNHLTFTVNSRIKLNFTKLNDLLFLPSTEEIWISDSEGIYIYRLNKQKKIEVNSVSEKIFSSEVFALVTDEKNRVWASTRFGVQVFNRKNGRSFFVSKPHGVINAEFYPRSAFKMRNGDLIFGGLSSYELMKPKFLDSLNYSKDFFLSAVQITRKSDLHRKLDFLIPQDSTIKLLTGKEQITVYLTNPDFIESSNYKFEFRINDNQWSHVGVSNSVFIADLPYGDHVLQIKMLDPFGNVVSFREIKIESIVSFYQRNEFLLLLIILLLVSVVIIVYTYKRINRVAAETKERIAMDLHDESGTVLTRLNMLIAAKNDLSNDREYLISSLNEALFSLRIFIFSFSNQKLKITNLEDGIKEFLQKTLIQTNIKWRVSAKVNKDHFISGELYRDIKLCVFEAINNIMKHAQCENVLIELISDKKVLTLKITDDGILENTDHLTGKGNGISNLKKRTKRNQGTCSFYILDERKGLTVELKFPIQ